MNWDMYGQELRDNSHQSHHIYSHPHHHQIHMSQESVTDHTQNLAASSLPHHLQPLVLLQQVMNVYPVKKRTIQKQESCIEKQEHRQIYS